jgi:hypothetical protein
MRVPVAAGAVYRTVSVYQQGNFITNIVTENRGGGYFPINHEPFPS